MNQCPVKSLVQQKILISLNYLMSIAGVSLSKISAKAFDNLQLLYRRKRGNTTPERLIVWSFVALQLTAYTCVSHSSQSLLVFSPTAR